MSRARSSRARLGTGRRNTPAPGLGRTRSDRGLGERRKRRARVPRRPRSGCGYRRRTQHAARIGRRLGSPFGRAVRPVDKLARSTHGRALRRVAYAGNGTARARHERLAARPDVFGGEDDVVTRCDRPGARQSKNGTLALGTVDSWLLYRVRERMRSKPAMLRARNYWTSRVRAGMTNYSRSLTFHAARAARDRSLERAVSGATRARTAPHGDGADRGNGRFACGAFRTRRVRAGIAKSHVRHGFVRDGFTRRAQSRRPGPVFEHRLANGERHCVCGGRQHSFDGCRAALARGSARHLRARIGRARCVRAERRRRLRARLQRSRRTVLGPSGGRPRYRIDAKMRPAAARASRLSKLVRVQQIADVVDAFDAEVSESRELFADGGPTRSDALMQLQADVAGRPVLRARDAELSALGAAHLAVAAQAFGRGKRSRSCRVRATCSNPNRAALPSARCARRGIPPSPARVTAPSRVKRKRKRALWQSGAHRQR